MGNPYPLWRHYLTVAANPETDDAHLLAAARVGDRTALAALIGRHRPLLLRMCRQVLASGDAAEDATQEACLQAMLGMDRLREPASFGPWLVGIGMNVCRHWHRQAARESYAAMDLTGGSARPFASLEAGPEDLAEVADIAERVRSAVSELPAGQRGAVVGFYLDGLTYQETADALGIGVPAVKTRLHKGRASLRTRLRTLWEDVIMETESDAVEMRIVEVRSGAYDREAATAASRGGNIVLLEEVGGDRQLPIWIGGQEAMSLARLLQNLENPRPMAPQFMFNALRAVGARVVEVRIDRLASNTFYAVAVIEGPSGTAEVDARPSDALNAALLADARVTARPDVLAAAAPEARQTMATLAERYPFTARDIADSVEFAAQARIVRRAAPDEP